MYYHLGDMQINDSDYVTHNDNIITIINLFIESSDKES